MAREDRPASNTTAGPAVPGPRRPATGQGDAEHGDIEQSDTGQSEGTEAPSPAQASVKHVLEHTRLGGIWVAVGCFLVVLVFLLVFILQNDKSVNVSFFGAHANLYLGVALVLAAVCGALLVMFAGVARIMQLRSRTRKHRRATRKAAAR
ncbi:MAG: putative integral rane protein-like protein [Actinomycetia bacterium]|nr:putative integral rane protein-like protein [Actinomycetes bacterium]